MFKKKFCNRHQLLFILTLCSCTNLFLQPSKDRFFEPSEIKISYNEKVLHDGKGPDLIMWDFPAAGKETGVILFLHGNAENVSTHFRSILWLQNAGYHITMVDYRGYGGSQGTASIEGAIEDSKRALDAVFSEARKKIIVYGQSLGASLSLAVAAQGGSKEQIKLVIAEAPFASYRAIAKEKMGQFFLLQPLSWILQFLVNDRYSPQDQLDQITAPVLLIHGTHDEVVSPAHSELLCKKLAQRCHRKLFEGKGHINIFDNQQAQHALLKSIDELIFDEASPLDDQEHKSLQIDREAPLKLP